MIRISADENQPEWIREADGEDEGPPVDTKLWVPYEGPQGGTGWENTDNGEVVYGTEPPGRTHSIDELRSMLGDNVVDDMLETMPDWASDALESGEVPEHEAEEPDGGGLPTDDIADIREPTDDEVRGNTTASGVAIATTDDGEKLYIKDADAGEYERVETGSKAVEALGVDVPEREFMPGRDAMAVEEVEGESLLESAEEADNAPRAIAATLLAGETDPRPGNYVVRDDGSVVPVDMDQVAGTDGGYLESQMTSFTQSVEFLPDFPFDEDDVLQEAESIADDVDPGELRDQLPDNEHADRVVSNIEQFKGGADEKAEAGDLDYGDERLRIWVRDTEDVPDGRVGHRVPGGLHYFDVAPGEGESEIVSVPDDALWTAVVDAEDASTWHPAARAAQKGGGPWRLRHGRADHAPNGLTLKSDGDSLFTEHDRFPLEELGEGRMPPADQKAWTEYRGPAGGEGYMNTLTGEVRYTETNPTDLSEEPGEEPGHPDMEGRAIQNARSMDTGEAASVVANVTNIDADALASRAESLPGTGGEAIARTAVQALQSENDEEGIVNLLEAFYESDADDGGSEPDSPGATNERPFPDNYTEVHTGSTVAKSWVPYEGPQGGKGWRNVDSGEVIYGDEPPGEAASAEDILVAAEDAGMDADKVRDAIESARDGESGDGASEETEPDVVKRAVDAVGESDTSALTDEMETDLEQRVKHDAANVVDADVAETVFGHVGEYQRSGLRRQDKDRAFHRGKASYSDDPDASSTMGLGQSGASDGTITHEYGHALVDAFGYDTPGEKATSHDWSTGVRGPTEDGWKNGGWDFGGKHDGKKDYMLTNYGAWEDRGAHDWDEYTERGERVTSTDDLRMGDRVAFDGRRSIIEGTVTPYDRAVEDVMDLEEGAEVTISGGEDVGGKGWGKARDEEMDGEVVATLESGDTLFGDDDGDYLVIAEDNTYPLPPDSNPDVYETRPEVVDVIDLAGDAALVDTDEGPVLATDTDFTEAEGVETPDYAVKSAGSGAEFPVGGKRAGAIDFDEGVTKTREANDRDWVTLNEFGEGELRGEAARFRFGANDKVRTGTITDETGGQVRIEFIDGNGNRNERWVNKSQSFQQSVWVAEDRKEFGEPSPSESPPGFDQARYENEDYGESDVDWDTHVQYEDPDEVAGDVHSGDLLLVNVAGERVPVKVTESRRNDSDFGDHDYEFSVTYGKDAAEQVRDSAGMTGQALVAGGDYGTIHLPSDDTKVWGHAEKEQLVGEVMDDANLEDFDGDPMDLETGDVVDYRSEDGTGSGRYRRGRVVDKIERDRGDLLEIEDAAGDTDTRTVDHLDIGGAATGLEEPDAESLEPEEAVEQLFEDVNRAWYSMASKREKGASRSRVGSIGSTYSESNAHETMSMTHETMQAGRSPSDAAVLMDKHPDLLESYLNVFEPDDDVKAVLNETHEDSAVSPFDDTPFPEAGTPFDWPDYGDTIDVPPKYRDELGEQAEVWAVKRPGGDDFKVGGFIVQTEDGEVDIDADEYREYMEGKQ